MKIAVIVFASAVVVTGSAFAHSHRHHHHMRMTYWLFSNLQSKWYSWWSYEPERNRIVKVRRKYPRVSSRYRPVRTRRLTCQRKTTWKVSRTRAESMVGRQACPSLRRARRRPSTTRMLFRRGQSRSRQKSLRMSDAKLAAGYRRHLYASRLAFRSRIRVGAGAR